MSAVSRQLAAGRSNKRSNLALERPGAASSDMDASVAER